MTRLQVGDRVKIVDAPAAYRHMLGQAGRVIAGGRSGADVALRTDSGKLIRGERGQFLKIGDSEAVRLPS